MRRTASQISKKPVDSQFILDAWKVFQSMSQPRRFDETRTIGWLLVGIECGLRVKEVCQLTVCCWIRLAEGHVDLTGMVLDTKNNHNMALERSKSRMARAEHPLYVSASLGSAIHGGDIPPHATAN